MVVDNMVYDGYEFDFLIKYIGNHFVARAKYESLGEDYIREVVKEIIMNNHDLFSKEEVLSYKNGNACKRCGRCCERQFCNKYNPMTKLCSDHENRPQICRDFPYGEFTIFLDSYCGYITDFFFDKVEYFLAKKVSLK